MPIPVYIISGFLGAGKTTLIHHIVETFSDSARMFIIHDELGKFPIDGESFDDRKKSWIVSLQPGHPPCAFLRELIGTLRYACIECNPDCILIELNGLTHPGFAARIIQPLMFEDRLALRGIITVVNPADVLNHDERLIEEQIKAAHILVMNKEDVLDKEAWQPAHDRVASLARKQCKILRSSHAKVDTYTLFSGIASDAILHEPVSQSGITKMTGEYAVMNFFSHATLFFQGIETLLDRHSQHIIRAKGLLRMDIGEKIVQWNRKEISMLNTSQDLAFSKLVMVTKADQKEAIQRDFSSIFLSDVL